MKRNLYKIKQQAEAGVVDLYIYDEIRAEANFDFVEYAYKTNESSADYILKKLDEFAPVTQINIYINSLGGNVWEGRDIYNILKRNPANKTVYIDGIAASIASVIAMAGDEIIMPKNTMMMIHNAAWQVYGTAAELRKAADDLDKINEAGNTAYLDKSAGKITAEKLAELMDAETFLTAEECLSYGFCDKVIGDNGNKVERIAYSNESSVEQRLDAISETLTGIQEKLHTYISKHPEAPEQKEQEDVSIFKNFKKERIKSNEI